MKEFKGTKGEWGVSQTPTGKFKVVDDNGFSVATLAYGKTSEADAKLMAVAPLMLRELQYILAELKHADDTIQFSHSDVIRIGRLLTTALGE